LRNGHGFLGLDINTLFFLQSDNILNQHAYSRSPSRPRLAPSRHPWTRDQDWLRRLLIYPAADPSGPGSISADARNDLGIGCLQRPAADPGSVRAQGLAVWGMGPSDFPAESQARLRVGYAATSLTDHKPETDSLEAHPHLAAPGAVTRTVFTVSYRPMFFMANSIPKRNLNQGLRLLTQAEN
jgi:hypothetical protein